MQRRRVWLALGLGLGLGLSACGPSRFLPGATDSAGLGIYGNAQASKARLTTSKYGGYGALIDKKVAKRLTADESGSVETEAGSRHADLRGNGVPVQNQGLVGACSGFAIAGLREYLLKRETGRYTQLSPRFVYYVERQMMDRAKKSAIKNVENDTGAYPVDGMESLSTVGIPAERTTPFASLSVMGKWQQATLEARDQAIKNFVSAAPTPGAFSEAKQYKLRNGFRTLKTLGNLKNALNSGSPVVLSMVVFDSFESSVVARTGQMPMPNPKKEKELGGHAVCVVGYDDREQHLIVRNSWGAKWGDDGHFYMPYEFVKQGFAYEALTDK